MTDRYPHILFDDHMPALDEYPTWACDRPEFNRIVGLILDQLYQSYPVAVEIDRDRIAGLLAVEVGDWSLHLAAMMQTINWMSSNHYVLTFNTDCPSMMLSEKALANLHRSPSNQGSGNLAPRYSDLINDACRGRKWEQFDYLIPHMIGYSLLRLRKSEQLRKKFPDLDAFFEHLKSL